MACNNQHIHWTLQLTYYLAKVSPTCEQLPNVGGGQLPVSSECVCQVATDLKMKDKVDSISITPPQHCLKPRTSLGHTAGRDVGDIVKYCQKYPNKIRKCSSSDEARYSKQEPCMPKGWKFRKTLRRCGKVDTEFLSPDVSMNFRSRVSVVKYMKYSGQYSLEDIDKAESK